VEILRQDAPFICNDPRWLRRFPRIHIDWPLSAGHNQDTLVSTAICFSQDRGCAVKGGSVSHIGAGVSALHVCSPLCRAYVNQAK
jgi:hypothetical protein